MGGGVRRHVAGAQPVGQRGEAAGGVLRGLRDRRAGAQIAGGREGRAQEPRRGRVGEVVVREAMDPLGGAV
jgi:hypothetical protein